ncbi:MAG: FMN-dependent NADH-azoreductase [Eubacteriales bacterium]|jgi:FMN-dependent NADH-azoreductase
MRILVLKASPLGHDSVSNAAADAFVEACRTAHPEHQITIKDLSALTLPPITADVLRYWDRGLREEEATGDLATLLSLCNEFVAADAYVIAASHWNLMVNPTLVHYMVCVMRAGKTFRYTENGSVGLLTGKKAQLIIASGGHCQDAAPTVRCYGEDWLRGLLTMAGVQDISTLFIQGMEQEPQRANEIVAQGIAQAAQLGTAWL